MGRLWRILLLPNICQTPVHPPKKTTTKKTQIKGRPHLLWLQLPPGFPAAAAAASLDVPGGFRPAWRRGPGGDSLVSVVRQAHRVRGDCFFLEREGLQGGRGGVKLFTLTLKIKREWMQKPKKRD